MSGVNFYLKKAEPTTGKSLIYLQYKFGGSKLTFTFNQTIDPKHWNKAKQRVKSNTTTTADGKYSLNDLLDTLKEICERTYHEELKNGFPSPEMIKLKLINFMNRKPGDDGKPSFFKLAARFVSGEIKHKGKAKQKTTIKTYNTVTNHLKAFEVKERYPINFDTITLNFYYKYLSYLKKEGLAQNTIAKHIQVIKTFMNEAVDLGYTQNVEFKNRKFASSWEDADAVYLTDKEVMKLFRHDFSEDKRLDAVRDLFVFGCSVGLRFSDYSTIKAENIITVDNETFIKVKTQKTGELVIIPCSPVITQIFAKYASSPNKLPKALSNQKFNDYIKEACRKAKLTEKGRLLSDPEKELCDCVSSHTARRSFATNLYLEGFPTIELMKITGHRTESAFLKYIKVSKLDAAKRLSKHMQLKWSEKILKVA